MHKYLITYLIADFNGIGADRLRTGLFTDESTKGFVEFYLSVKFGFRISTTRWIAPGAILSIEEITK